MVFEIDNSSNKKQYIERDNFLLVDNDDIVKLNIFPQSINFRMTALFEALCGLLGLNDKESQIYYMVCFKRDSFDSFYKLGVEAAKIFKCHERSYYIYYMKMRKRGIITTDANTGRPVVAPQYDVEQFKNAKYVVLKIN